jgi:hypothetical protein
MTQPLASVVESCPHCRQRTVLEGKAHVLKDSGGDNHNEPYWAEHWELRRCVSCERPILRETLSVDIHGEEPQIQTLYPGANRGAMAGLPEKVAKAYEAALSVQSIEPNAYAVLIGRLLEVIAVEEGVESKRLVDQVRALSAADRIPPVLAEMADQLRQIRNFGAHAAAGEVMPDDVPVIAEFADAILEYLYRAPSKVAAVKARLHASKSSAGQASRR